MSFVNNLQPSIIAFHAKSRQRADQEIQEADGQSWPAEPKDRDGQRIDPGGIRHFKQAEERVADQELLPATRGDGEQSDTSRNRRDR